MKTSPRHPRRSGGRVGVTLVAGSAIGSRIHERLDRQQFRVRAIGGPQSVFRWSTHIDEYLAVGSSRNPRIGEIIKAIQDGLITPDDWVVFGTDGDLNAVARADIPQDLRLALLPTKKADGLILLGSKTGLVEISQRHDVRIPPTVIAKDSEALTNALKDMNRPFVLKGNGGAAGQQVRFVESGKMMDIAGIPAHWFPVLIQDFVEGPMISVEALFRESRLERYLYSEALQFSSTFGPSTSRYFHAPFASDFIDSLETVAAAAGLHGFANCSFIWDEQKRCHWLFEVDMRPNRWHQFGPDLGVSWAEGMLSDNPRAQKLSQPHHEAKIRLYPREISHALERRRYVAIIPWIRGETGTWEWRQKKDRAVNAQELISIGKAALKGVFHPTREIGGGD